MSRWVRPKCSENGIDPWVVEVLLITTMSGDKPVQGMLASMIREHTQAMLGKARPMSLFERRRSTRGSEVGDTEGYRHFYPQRQLSVPADDRDYDLRGLNATPRVSPVTQYSATAPATPAILTSTPMPTLATQSSVPPACEHIEVPASPSTSPSPHASLSRSVSAALVPAPPLPRSRGPTPQPKRARRSTSSRVDAQTSVTIDPLLLKAKHSLLKATSAPPPMSYAQPALGMQYVYPADYHPVYHPHPHPHPYAQYWSGPSGFASMPPGYNYQPAYNLTVQQVRAIGREQGRQLAEAAKADNRPVSDYLATYPYAPPPAIPIQNPFSSIGMKRKRALPNVHYPPRIIIPAPHHYLQPAVPSALPKLNSPLSAPPQPSLASLPSIEEVLASLPESPEDGSSPLTPPPLSPVPEVKPSKQKRPFMECPLCNKMFKPRGGTIDWHLAGHATRTCKHCQEYFARSDFFETHKETCSQRQK